MECWKQNSGTWKQSLSVKKILTSVCYTLKGPYVGALPSLYGIDDYKVGDGQNSSILSSKAAINENLKRVEQDRYASSNLGDFYWKFKF